MDPELLSVRKAAGRIGLSPATLRRAIRSDELPGYRPGKRTVFVRWPEVIGWIRLQRIGSHKHPRGHL